MKLKTRQIFNFLIAVLLIHLASCNSEEKLSYKEIKLQNEIIEYKTDETVMYAKMVRDENRVFSITTESDVRLIDLGKKNEKILFKKGVGPNEVYEPYSIRLFDKKCWVSPMGPAKFIYYFNPDSVTPLLNRMEMKSQLRYDDFNFLSTDIVLMTFVLWDDGLLKVYNKKTNEMKAFGKHEFIDLMLKFNISKAHMVIIDQKAYITQSIAPEIDVISLENMKGKIDKITLSPPFYVHIPEKYIKNQNNHTAHLKWMASWTSVFDILHYNDWILVTYRYGYEYLYSYELFNLKDSNHRYYINKTISRIYDFKVENNRVIFNICDQEEEGVIWKKMEAVLN